MKDLREEEPELDRAEDRAESQAEDQSPGECGFGGLDFSKGSTSGKGKPWKDAKVHGQDGEQDQEFGEESFWFFKQEEDPRPPLSLGVDHSSPLKGGSCPRSLTEPLLSSQGKGRQHAEKEEDSKARRSSSTTGLDRVQTEETQLDRAEGRVDLEEPLFENPGFEYDPTLPGLLSEMDPYNRFERAQAPPRPRKPHPL
ncbi:unnamed protein product [Microthlaspi erraticum]|uniref:Uncharacterized protein n=1 Tax=Microthlaspi erraticum TaxID=1685480 RepID=A0A6D2LMX6_9BRAS|nr:unnamed protein product [Microthlaspi erraticum]